MKPNTEQLLRWTPRILAFLFAGFLSIFALDVFGEGLKARQTVVALAMHLIPAVVVLAALAVSWRFARAGGLAFAALGAWYLVTAWGRFHWSAYAVIAGPLFLLALLFELDGWLTRQRAQPR